MLFRALIAMITADAINRHRRERQHQAWVSAAQARTAATSANASQRPVERGFDPLRPERPIGADSRRW